MLFTLNAIERRSFERVESELKASSFFSHIYNIQTASTKCLSKCLGERLGEPLSTASLMTLIRWLVIVSK